MTTRDTLGRPLRSLRLSVTDRCNLRCAYCMPEREYVWLPREDILDFEELAVLVDAFSDAGVDRVRLTGGEPLLRQDLHVLVGLLAQRGALKEVALTTNGVLLAEQAAGLQAAGLQRITVSLDTLDAATFRALARRDDLERVLEGIRAAVAAGLPLKLDTVLVRGLNDGELEPLLEFARSLHAELRFIEYMDVGGATRWSLEQVVTRAEILARLARTHGAVEALGERGSAPAERFRLADGTVFGIVGSTTAPFCGACDRSRLTADGQWLTCLYARTGMDLRKSLRSGATRQELAARIASAWGLRADRGAEERLQEAERGVLSGPEHLRSHPHQEMHTRGG